MTISIESLTTFCITALTKVGMSRADAETTAEALVTTDAMGVFTHGTKLLGGYLNRLKGGGYRATAVPRILPLEPALPVSTDGYATVRPAAAEAATASMTDRMYAARLGR